MDNVHKGNVHKGNAHKANVHKDNAPMSAGVWFAPPPSPWYNARV